ncbi:MAG: sigma-70 family RNA polymerase sigma factor [Actinomycetota bacterium]|nr:sigma-70 family RNA polymerase sigma factor [Actinomycetota bacterium]
MSRWPPPWFSPPPSWVLGGACSAGTRFPTIAAPPPFDDPSDDDLVAAARSGDRQALDRLLRRHHDRIWSICRRMAGNDADAADATQEALIAIATRLDRFDGRARFTTWLHRVATNACLDELRRRGRRPVPVEEVLPRSEADPSDAGLADRLDIDTALAELPDDFRIAVVLRDLCDLDYAAIAEALDLPPGTVRSRIARGRAALADRLGNPAAPDERQNQ